MGVAISVSPSVYPSIDLSVRPSVRPSVRYCIAKLDDLATEVGLNEMRDPYIDYMFTMFKSLAATYIFS